MCGRYTLRQIDAKRFGVPYNPPFEEFTERPRFNVAPSQAVPIVRVAGDDGTREAALAKWGLVPAWTRGKPKLRPINARAETVATSGMFRQPFARRRCLVPADGFYEWKPLEGKKVKQPYFVHFPDDRVFAFAGIWDRWHNEAGDDEQTVATITTTPNATMKPFHDRMPVILPEADYERWLDPETSTEEAIALLKPWPDGELEAYEVGGGVTRREDSAGNLEPL